MHLFNAFCFGDRKTGDSMCKATVSVWTPCRVLLQETGMATTKQSRGNMDLEETRQGR